MESKGRRFWLKRRPWNAAFIMSGANLFFRAVGNPVRAVVERDDWIAWEVEAFRLLHSPEFTAKSNDDGAIQFDLLPGNDASALLHIHALTPEVITSIGIELKRAHGFPCNYHNSAWSHGDCHTGNFLYDPSQNRARLIDFEVRHLRQLNAVARHADDLLILLQDVCGRCAEPDWLPLAQAFLKSYAPSAEVMQALMDRLYVPRGFSRLWWAVRTTWMKRAELEKRLEALRSVMKRLE